MAAAPIDPAVQQALRERFQLHAYLGSGPGYSSYAATNLEDHERISLRVLEREEFQPELDYPRLAALLEAWRVNPVPGVISGVWGGETGGLLWVARSWLPALPLLDLLRAQQQLSPPVACALLESVANACASVAAAGLPGLDLSPRPLLLTCAGLGEEELQALAARPLSQWPECRLAIEPIYGAMEASSSPGNYLFIPGAAGNQRQLLALLADFLGRSDTDPAAPLPPIVPSLGEAGNELLRRLWQRQVPDASLPSVVQSLSALFQDRDAPPYAPHPPDHAHIHLPEALLPLGEQIAEHIHDTWAARRLQEGWTYGPVRDDARRRHPGLIRYAALSEEEKGYDRATAVATLKTVLAFGFRIEPPG